MKNQIKLLMLLCLGITFLGMADANAAADEISAILQTQSNVNASIFTTFVLMAMIAVGGYFFLNHVNPVYAEAGNGKGGTGHNKRVLIVDDSKDMQRLIQLKLAQSDVNFQVAENGLEAIEALEGGEFDLVLMDINMPVMNGIEAVTRIRDNGNDIPVMAVSADIPDDEMSLINQNGFDEFIPKPINFNKLIDSINFHTSLNHKIH